MIAIKDMEMPKYCWYYDIDESKKWKECPIYKSCKCHTSNIDVKPSNCPLVEIVTCKDCKHRIGCKCESLNLLVDDNFYCADAEKEQ